MSMLYFDGFDGYDNSTDLYNYGKWEQYGFGGTAATIVGRDGVGKGLNLSGGNFADHYSLGSGITGKTHYVGFAMKIIANTQSGTVIYFQDQFNYNDIYTQVFMHYDITTKKLELRKGRYATLGSSTLLATSSMSLIEDTWYYIEVKFLCDSVSGVFELKINESVVASYTGNTQYTATNAVFLIGFGSKVHYPAQMYIDDVYILNSDGAINNTYLGDVKCTLTYPSADFATTFTPTGEASNYLCVDDPVGNPDEDTTYVSSSTVGGEDEYSVSHSITATDVYSVKVNTRAMKDDVNPRNFKHGVRTGSNANETEYVLGEGYGNYINVYNDQGNGTPWDQSSIDAMRSFIRVQS